MHKPLRQLRMKPYKPEIPASSVAAVIGLNAYKPPYEAMYSILKKDAIIKERIRTLESLHNRVSYGSIQRKVSSHLAVREIVNLGLAESKTNTDVVGIVESAKTMIDDIASIKYPSLPDNVRRKITKECASEIHKQRGLKNENEVLDQYEVETKTTVTERNTCMRKISFPEYGLCGRIDGYVESLNRIVDSKERTVHWPEVPIYDEIQLRVYMELMDCPEAELVERFPGGKKRNTVFTRDPARWKTIHDALVVASAEMTTASMDDAVLLKIIEANTFADI